MNKSKNTTSTIHAVQKDDNNQSNCKNENSRDSSVEFCNCIQKIFDRTTNNGALRTTFTKQDDDLPPLLSNELSELSYLCTAFMYEHLHKRSAFVPSPVASGKARAIYPEDSNASTNKRSRDNQYSTQSSYYNHNGNSRNSNGLGVAPLLFQLDVESDMIVTLVDLLAKQVRAALSVNFMEHAMNIAMHDSKNCVHLDEWIQPNGAGHKKLETLRMGLEAATIIIFLACCTNPSGNFSSFVNEDTMEASMALFRMNLAKYLVPSMNQTGHLSSSNEQRSVSITETKTSETNLGRSSTDVLDKRTKATKRSEKVNPVLLRDLKKLYRLIHDYTIKLQLLLMERIQMLVELIPLDDQQALLLANGSLSALEIDCFVASSTIITCSSNNANSTTPRQLSSTGSSLSSVLSPSLSTAQQLQLSCISLVTTIFKKYGSHREIILEDLFPVMLKVPTHKRSLRAFTLRYSSSIAPGTLQEANSLISMQQPPHCIQMMTALIIALVQSCVIRPSYENKKEVADHEITMDKNSSRIDGHAESTTQECANGSVKLSSGLRHCWTISETIVGQLLSRCATGKGDFASEYRPFLIHFVEDLLLAMIIPEYPAAEILLLSIQRRLNLDIMKASPAYNGAMKIKAPPEATYINLAFDILARINAFVASIFSLQRERSIKINSDKSTLQPEKMILSDYSKGQCTRNSILIRCDFCNVFYHGAMVGIQNADCVPDEWSCDSCRLGKIRLREQRRFGGNTIIDDNYTINHANLVCLSHRLGLHDIEDAKRVYIARWIDEAERLKHLDSLKQQVISGLLQYWESLPDGGPAGELLTDEGSVRAILFQLTRTSLLLKSFRAEMSFLIKLMSDETTSSFVSTHTLRKLSLKTIEKIVEGDPDLMLSSLVTKAVSNRLRDESIAVREAAVSLVGAYVVHSPAVANAFHSSLLSCLNDVGVSVRKRCVRIFQSILLSSNTTDYDGRSVLCDTLLQLAANPKEEDGVRDLIQDLFFNLWLTNCKLAIETLPATLVTPSPSGTSLRMETNDSPYKQQNVNPTGDECTSTSKVETQTPTTQQSATVRRRADITAEQMMEVVRQSGSGENLYNLLKDLLMGIETNEDSDPNSSPDRRSIRSPAASIAAKKKQDKRRIAGAEAEECLQVLVDSLFELLVSIEEKRTSEQNEEIGIDLAATLKTIEVFARLAPASIPRHVDTLLPYLKGDNVVSMDIESSIVCAVCNILFRLACPGGNSAIFSSSHNVNDFRARLTINSSIANDLVQIAYRFGSSTLDSAMRTLSVLSMPNSVDCKSDVMTQTLLTLAKTFYKFLYKNMATDDFSTSTMKIQSGIHRGLTILGLVCQYRDDSLSSEVWDVEVDTSALILIPPKEIDWLNLPLACYRLFSKYLSKNDLATKCKAMEALGALFLAQPRLVLQLEKIGLISDVMSESVGLSLQLEALDCWKRILVSEEKRVDGGDAHAKMDGDGNITVSKKISGDQDGDATLFGGVLTNHSKRLFEMMHSKSPNLRFSSLELLGLLLRQGLVNPNEAVPHLFALQGDIENATIREMSLRLLITEGEKRPDILRQRICAGVKQAYYLQRSIYSNEGEVSALILTTKTSAFGRNAVDVDCIFNGVFTESIVKYRKQRRGLYTNLLGLFEIQDLTLDEPTTTPTRKKSIASAQKNQLDRDVTKDIALLSFVAQVLAHLPYNTINDPLFVVHHIGSIIALNGQLLLDRFASLLRPHGLSESDELDENNLSEDALERAAATKFPSRTNQAKPLNTESFDLTHFARLCQDAISLSLLLCLKIFLCEVYNLSYIRCIEFDPNVKERVCEKGLRRNTTARFESFVSVGNGIDKDCLIRQYSQFRRLMREEQSIDQGEDAANSGDEYESEQDVIDDDDNDSHDEVVNNEYSNVSVEKKRAKKTK